MGTIEPDIDDFSGDTDTVSDGEGPKERRTDERVEAVFSVRYQTLDEFVVAYTADISRGGMFIASDHLWPIGSVIRLELALPNNGPLIRIIARVAFTRSDKAAAEQDQRAGMGVEFLDIHGAPLEQQLEAYLTLSIDDVTTNRIEPANVLVVDDDANYRRHVADCLRERGHKVVLAKNGIEGLGAALRYAPELIVTDVQMPTMDGWQLTRMIRARPSLAHIPIVMLTSLGTDDQRLRGYQLGVDDYLVKPGTAESIVTRVERVLTRTRSQPRTTVSKNALRGDLEQVSLQSVLSFVELERRTGHLLLVADDQLATLHVLDGRVLQVDLPEAATGLEGVHRLYHVLSWTNGRFELTSADVTVADSIGVATSYALLEHARITDESGAS